MNIKVSGAVGWGATELSAFDHALNLTGVANYNLLRLSSVIPPASKIVRVDSIDEKPGTWGDRLYVVYAEQRTSTPGDEAWAGIGWVQDPSDGKGLFVEHEGHSEAQVRADIEASLKGLLKNRDMKELAIQMKVVGGKCIDQPICSFVVAAYQVSDWKNQAYLY
jgi:arginine decarboxylase